MKPLFLFTAFATAAFCQEPHTQFEVASVKPDLSGSGHTGIDRDGVNLRMTGVTLRGCIALAWRVTNPQIAGPEWIDVDKYEITAKTVPGASGAQFSTMLQSLLAERFGLALHHETRELPVYALVVARGGPKMEKVKSETPDDGSTSSGRGHLKATELPMSKLADFLARPNVGLGRPVIDQTSLAGAFNFTLEWTPEGASASKESRSDGPPTIFTAIQEQLGLKLEAKKAPIEVLVIDHANKVPTAN